MRVMYVPWQVVRHLGDKSEMAESARCLRQDLRNDFELCWSTEDRVKRFSPEIDLAFQKRLTLLHVKCMNHSSNFTDVASGLVYGL